MVYVRTYLTNVTLALDSQRIASHVQLSVPEASDTSGASTSPAVAISEGSLPRPPDRERALTDASPRVRECACGATTRRHRSAHAISGGDPNVCTLR